MSLSPRLALTSTVTVILGLAGCSHNEAAHTDGMNNEAMEHGGMHEDKHEGMHEGMHEAMHNEGGGQEHHAHGAPGSTLALFHDVLAPLWHAPEGDKRTQDTCAAVPNLHALSTKMAAEPAPAGAAATFVDKAKALDAAVVTLDAACGTPDRKDFMAAFTAMHEAFHAAAESAGN